MLSNANAATFRAGLEELQRLAERHPKKYHIRVMKILIQHVRDRMCFADKGKDFTGLPNLEDPERKRAEHVLRAIGKRSIRAIKEEKRSKYLLDLSNIDARAMNLSNCNFSRVNANGTFFSQANLNGIFLRCSALKGTKFNGAMLQLADLSHANLEFAYMAGADLSCGSLAGSRLRWTDMPNSLYLCNLSDARMFEVKGLQQEKLDAADGWIRRPPSIIASLDPETGNELCWRGGNKSPVSKLIMAMGWKRATSFIQRALARLLPQHSPAEEIIASEMITTNLRFYVQRIGRQFLRQKYYVYRWERNGNHSSAHTKICEEDHQVAALAALERIVGEQGAR